MLTTTGVDLLLFGRGIYKAVDAGIAASTVTKVYGETVTVIFANGKIDSVYGAITVTKEMLLN